MADLQKDQGNRYWQVHQSKVVPVYDKHLQNPDKDGQNVEDPKSLVQRSEVLKAVEIDPTLDVRKTKKLSQKEG